MAPRENHENQQLANRLVAAADGIVNSAARGLEQDLRTAAVLIVDGERPTVPLLPILSSELAKIANTTTDSDTALKLRRLLGKS
jgi:hypothetical protein